MKLSIVLLALMSLARPGQASTLTVIGPCSEKPAFASGEIHHAPTTLGDFTVKTLSTAGIPFKGSREGITSILNSPSGDAALEVLNSNSMRAYGWCVSVDGKQPSRLPHEVQMTGSSKVIWFYAYATYVNGEWKEFCIPSYQLKSSFICKKTSHQINEF